jgi:glycosyltransferase involved in cell wall biosynthesis
MRVLVDTLHSSYTGGWGRHFGYRASDWLTDRVTAVSHAAADAHLAARFTDPRKLTVLANGVDLDARSPDPSLRAEVRGKLGIGDGFLWLSAGRLEPVKDYPTLLRALAIAADRPHLVIAGDGSLNADLRRLTKAISLQDRVHFLGFRADLRSWMHAADAFVLSSLWEGLPLAVLEAAAACLPCVATDVQGTREAIVDGDTGFLAPAGDTIALRDAMNMMMRLRLSERTAMGQKARSFVEKGFSLNSVLDRWEATYTQLLERNPDRTRRCVRLDRLRIVPRVEQGLPPRASD